MYNLLFSAHTLSFLFSSKQLSCFVQAQGQKSEHKHTTKGFVGLQNHFPVLTMVICIQTNQKIRNEQFLYDLKLGPTGYS